MALALRGEQYGAHRAENGAHGDRPRGGCGNRRWHGGDRLASVGVGCGAGFGTVVGCGIDDDEFRFRGRSPTARGWSGFGSSSGFVGCGWWIYGAFGLHGAFDNVAERSERLRFLERVRVLECHVGTVRSAGSFSTVGISSICGIDRICCVSVGCDTGPRRIGIGVRADPSRGRDSTGTRKRSGRRIHIASIG